MHIHHTYNTSKIKQGLIFALYSPGRELPQKELEASLTTDLVNFDFITLPPADSIANIAKESTNGYNYAIEHGYEFVARIDDDDLLVPGALTHLAKVLKHHTMLSGVCGKQLRFRGAAPDCILQPVYSLFHDPHYHRFHGVTLYRTLAVPAALENWQNVANCDPHRKMVKIMLELGHTLGYIDSYMSYFRLKKTDLSGYA